MDKHVGHTLIKYASPDEFFAENQERQLESKKDPGLEMIPWARKVYGLSTPQGLSLIRAFFPDPGRSDELLEAENDATRAVLGNDANLSEGELRWIVASTQSSGFELKSSEFSQNLFARLVLSLV